MLKEGMNIENKKGQKGLVVKVITRSTGYCLVRYEDGSERKEMAFNLNDENGRPVRKAPAPRKASAAPSVECIAGMLQRCNSEYFFSDPVNESVWRSTLEDVEKAAQAAGESFVLAVLQTVSRTCRCSDKQAAVLARFARKANVF